jgi:hypothetical protein
MKPDWLLPISSAVIQNVEALVPSEEELAKSAVRFVPQILQVIFTTFSIPIVHQEVFLTLSTNCLPFLKVTFQPFNQVLNVQQLSFQATCHSVTLSFAEVLKVILSVIINFKKSSFVHFLLVFVETSTYSIKSGWSAVQGTN